MKDNNQISLHDIFKGLQRQMTYSLETARENIQHPSTKGTVTEDEWLNLFKKYLPQRYTAERAFVIDSYDHISEQQDVVIFDRHYSPFIYKTDSTAYIPAESVYAVIEVKQSLNKEHLVAAANKVSSVRNLHRTSKQIVHAGGTFPARQPGPIIGGIVALESEWTPPFGDAFRELLKSFDLSHHVNIGCSLKDGAFENILNDGGASSLWNSPSETALISFFLKLLNQLQSLGTVPAMDLGSYLAAVNKEF